MNCYEKSEFVTKMFEVERQMCLDSYKEIDKEMIAKMTEIVDKIKAEEFKNKLEFDI